MKQLIIFSLLLFSTLHSWAQYRGASVQMSVADKSKEIPMKPIVVDGELKGIPDGCRVSFAFRVKKTRAWDTANNTLIDTIRNGRFHIEKKFIYKDFDENEDNVEYIINVEGKSLFVFAYPGARVKVTGTPALNAISWRAESDHPLQKEFYEYADYENAKLSAIRGRIQEEYEADEVDENLVKRLERERDSIRVVSMLDFMKNRECNSVFACYLSSISSLAKKLDNSQLKDKLRSLITEKVPNDNDDQNIIEAKAFLSINHEAGREIRALRFGDKMRDFTLYDRKGNQHRLSEFKGKYTVLELTSRICTPCLEVMPVLDGFYRRNRDKVEVIAISVDGEGSWLEETNNVSYHEWNDRKYATEIGNAYGAKGTPCFVIIHPNGNILDISHGARSFFREMIQHIPDAEIEKELKTN